MDHTRFGRTGREVPRHCLGSNPVGTGHVCCTSTREAIVGRALALRPASGETAALQAPDVPHAVPGLS